MPKKPTYQDLEKRVQELEEKIKDYKTTEEEIKSDFLSKMTHDLRTPMQGVLGYAKLGISRIDKVGKEKLLQYFNTIYDSSQRLVVLLNNMHELARLEAGINEFCYSRTKLSDLVKSAIKENLVLVGKKNLNINFKPPAFSDNIIVDIEKIAHLLKTLLSESILYSPEHSTIQIQISERNYNEIIFSINDQGVNIPEEELSLVFEKFVQSNQTSTRANDSGLGFTICREIINAHNGKIWAENNSKAETCYLFTVPLSEKPNS